MQARCGQHMLLDQFVDRGQRHAGMADQICQSGQAEIDALSCNALGLPVQRLVLSVFVGKPTPRAVFLC